MSLRKFVYSTIKDEDDQRWHYDASLAYVKNVLSFLGVRKDDLKLIAGNDAYLYEINDNIERILKNYYYNGHVPTKPDLKKAFKERNQIYRDAIKVAKNFIEYNFTNPRYEYIKKIVNSNLEKTQKELLELISMLTETSNCISDNMLSFIIVDKPMNELKLLQERLNLINQRFTYDYMDVLYLINLNYQLQDLYRIIRRDKKSIEVRCAISNIEYK